MTSQLRTRWTRLLSGVTGVALAVGFSALAVATPAQAATQDGVYVGENSHGYDISITVANGKVTDVLTSATAFCGTNPPLPFQVPFNEIPQTTIGPDGSFQAHWTYQIDADYSAEYWLGGTFHDDGTVTSSGSNAADMVGVGLLCTGTQFTYEAAVDGTPAPQITVTPNPATLSQITDPNGPVAFRGSGFAPASTVALSIDGQQAATRVAGADGKVEVRLQWQNATVGSHSARFTSGPRTAEATFSIIADPTYTPTVAVNPSTVIVSRLAGDGVTVTGAGFPASVPVEISFDGAVVATVDSDAAGSLTHSLVRAGVLPGTHTVTLANAQWTASAALIVDADPVQYDPDASVSPSTLMVSELAATGVQISGAGFPPSAPVGIDVGGVTVATIDSSATGDVSYTYKKADAEVAQYAVILTSGAWSARTSFEVTADPVVYEPVVVVTPESVSQSDLASTGVRVNGTGFPESSAVEVLFDGAVVTTVTSTADGTIDTMVSRAGVTAGTSTVLLRSGAWQAADTVTVTADPIDPADVTLSPAQIATGVLETAGVDLTAEGLPAGVPVRVLFNGNEVDAFTATVDGKGTASFTVADVAPGAYAVQLVQGPGFAAGDVLGEATLTVMEDPAPAEPEVALDVTSITTGALERTGVVITGTGFAPGESVAVLFDSREMGTVVADAAGAIAYTLKVAGAGAGDHRITLVQGDLRADATVTVTAPPTPTPAPTTRSGGGLAATGTDAGFWAFIAAAAIALIAAGGVAAVRRRQA